MKNEISGKFCDKKVYPVLKQLTTPFEKDLTSTPWSEYPRPQLKRDSYFCLNGEWNLSVKSGDSTTDLGKILVPFVPQSRISGINRNFDKNDILVYSRRFTLPDGFAKDKVIINFGACDQECTVYINGKFVGGNIGGYIPFSFDITEYLLKDNEIMVMVTDRLNTDLPYGKQRFKRGGMWYTQISGIWQTVWLESVSNGYIEGIKITPDTEKAQIEITSQGDKIEVTFEGQTYCDVGNCITLTPKNPICWTPENPHLYEFSIKTEGDTVTSYFALRTLSIKDGKIQLNNEPYFFNGLLDQGYFSDGIFLPATPDGFKFDIINAKELGFNMLRKHIKIEPDLFYYYCDKYGMVVFQDMVNSGKYSFIIDTALPTVLLKKGISHRASKFRREQFEKTAANTVALLYNHPSVCYYTLFNEGWGQYDTKRLYAQMKSLDSTRIWDAASGWFYCKDNDVISEHIYFKPIKTNGDGIHPAVISEFGGYSYKINKHSFNFSKTYGYKYFTDEQKFTVALEKLYNDQIIPSVKRGVCAAVMTQISDVEDETNGLITYDRQFIKVDKNRMRAISDRLFNAFNGEQK